MHDTKAGSEGTAAQPVLRRGSDATGNGEPESVGDTVHSDSPRRERADDGSLGSSESEPPAWEEKLIADCREEASRLDQSMVAAVCAWCPNVNILRMQRRDTDTVIVYQHGRNLHVFRNGQELQITHGICQRCRKERI